MRPAYILIRQVGATSKAFMKTVRPPPGLSLLIVCTHGGASPKLLPSALRCTLSWRNGMKSSQDLAKRESKKQGRHAAQKWSAIASVDAQVALAGTVFDYGETLDGLRDDDFDVPSSKDEDFSWGFYKEVKRITFNAVEKSREYQRNMQAERPSAPRGRHE